MYVLTMLVWCTYFKLLTSHISIVYLRYTVIPYCVYYSNMHFSHIIPFHSILWYDTKQTNEERKKHEKKHRNGNCSNSYIIAWVSWKNLRVVVHQQNLHHHFLFMYLMHCCWFWSFAHSVVNSYAGQWPDRYQCRCVCMFFAILHPFQVKYAMNN